MGALNCQGDLLGFEVEVDGKWTRNDKLNSKNRDKIRTKADGRV